MCPSTATSSSSGCPILTFSPSENINTRSNVTGLPTSPGIFSTRRICPCWTLYCFPPELTTAYMGSASCNLIFVSLVQNQQILIFSHDLSRNIFVKNSATKPSIHKKIELYYSLCGLVAGLFRIMHLNWTYHRSVIL